MQEYTANSVSKHSDFTPEILDSISTASQLFYPNSKGYFDDIWEPLIDLNVKLRRYRFLKDMILALKFKPNIQLLAILEEISSLRQEISKHKLELPNMLEISVLPKLLPTQNKLQLVEEQIQENEDKSQELELLLVATKVDLESLKQLLSRLKYDSNCWMLKAKENSIRAILCSMDRIKNVQSGLVLEKRRLLNDLESLEIVWKSNNNILVGRRKRLEGKLAEKLQQLEVERKYLKEKKRVKQLEEKAFSIQNDIFEKAQTFKNTLFFVALESEDKVWKSFKLIKDYALTLNSEEFMENLVNPNEVTKLPNLIESFRQTKFRQDHNGFIQFQGRQAMKFFCKIYDEKPTQFPIMLYGTKGSGKSHMLLALASYILVTGQNAIYFSDAKYMMNVKAWGEKFLLLLVNEGCSELMVKLLSMDIVNTPSDQVLMVFAESFSSNLIIDQLDELKNTNIRTEFSKHKEIILEYITHKWSLAILSTSGDDYMMMDRFKPKLAPSLNYFCISSGFSEEEYRCWKFNNFGFLPEMTFLQESLLKFATGLVPLYLDPFLWLEGNTFVDRYSALEQRLSLEVGNTIDSYYNGVDYYLNAVEGCIKQTAVTNLAVKVDGSYSDTSKEKDSCCFELVENRFDVKIRQTSQKPVIDSFSFFRYLIERSEHLNAAFLIQDIGIEEVSKGFSLNNIFIKPKTIGFMNMNYGVKSTDEEEVKYYRGGFIHPGIDCLFLFDNGETVCGIKFTINKKEKNLVPLFIAGLKKNPLFTKIQQFHFVWWVDSAATMMELSNYYEYNKFIFRQIIVNIHFRLFSNKFQNILDMDPEFVLKVNSVSTQLFNDCYPDFAESGVKSMIRKSDNEIGVHIEHDIKRRVIQ